ncbi:MAG: heat-inducible transcription repressor HrcA [Candidatus Abyssobacteria bacterium SURF_5]|uniref:Heat-inducible transcription repressor HrcA n=1 Tax=Abyssobacteria bacterium (strain SURF_5) TaxID=2093360 RepID=A0A3A4NSY2_ABYX5|nr:MAG: heat-inducible transcription repressor HrcA [Candidatus Abyssubacteria bacterium SURF_5]
MKQDASLNDRQKDVLQAVVTTHIMTASAVGSRTVAKKMGFKLSPASIRNVMADLEEQGYVRQPHTSAGRVPTDVGYRVYVDDLMDIYELALDELLRIEESLGPGVVGLEELMGLACRLLSFLTQYTAVVQTPKVETETIRHVEIVSLTSEKILTILVTNLGEVRKRVFSRPARLADEEIEKLSAYLNREFCSLSFAGARSHLESYHKLSSASEDYLLSQLAIEVMAGLFFDETPREVFLVGMENIFSQPEFQDVERLRPLLKVLDEKKQLNELFETFLCGEMTPGVYIRIGRENPVDGITSCSVIASPYHIGGRTMGAIGVIGPTRMHYARASSLVAVVADKLGHILTVLSGG